MKPVQISYALLLPLLDIGLWLLLVVTPIMYAYMYLSQPPPVQEQSSAKSALSSIALPQVHPFALACNVGTIRTSHFIAGLNIPGEFLEVLIAVPTTWPDTWHPEALMSDPWRAMIFPIYCLPVWWFAGRGLDGLIRNRRLHWLALLFGSLLFVGFMALACGFIFGLSVSERNGALWPWYGLMGWAAAFAVFPITWLLRGSSRRKQSTAA